MFVLLLLLLLPSISLAEVWSVPMTGSGTRLDPYRPDVPPNVEYQLIVQNDPVTGAPIGEALIIVEDGKPKPPKSKAVPAEKLRQEFATRGVRMTEERVADVVRGMKRLRERREAP
jgi:hypothetical protein